MYTALSFMPKITYHLVLPEQVRKISYLYDMTFTSGDMLSTGMKSNDTIPKSIRILVIPMSRILNMVQRNV